MLPEKTLKFIIFAASCLALLFFAQVSITQSDSVSLRPPIVVDPNDPDSDGLDIEGIIGKIANVIFGLGIIICPIAIVWGGFEIALAQGDQEKVTKGKQIIQYSVIGLLIIALSSALVTAIRNVL